ncbi:D-alanyl-D-alanine carboxypeptidase/D-alanyl-D-alanine-endopeptidase [Oscillatoria sp. CS-180]|uniref:D-alanyl-D-alanine carboxypeptidase/D-alanyl-D-alanine endopeptidase n=1 Tax=Oscillatoria sp. CS-180 TaxID=3021720 RepID=UPI00232A9F87|nr:D-alanyl-D-alanine carboxypeptidase/D-alanyl-D-alanine-endopeptidase [Oscillatoria sp. CS-180]MDB9525377.1 D-alanyl-D-alanine carboxypeptidase/D-alanyl-D-alanine-endopeptidase [Oscillatoria sp. CS-180]
MSNRWQKWALFGWGLTLTAIAPAPATAMCVADLPEAIEAITARPELSRARVGIQVETVAGERVYERDSDLFFVPASTLKLLTTAAVLTEWGPDYTLRTPVYGQIGADGTAILQVIGQGDPSFDQSTLDDLADQIVQRNVQEIDALYGDDSAFVGTSTNPNWEWEDVQAGYGAPANALILNENELGLSLLPQAVDEPLQVVWDDPAQEGRWIVENHSRTVAAGEPEFVRAGRSLGLPILRVWGQLVVGTDPESVAIAIPNPGEVFLDAFRRTLVERDILVRQTRLAPPPTGIVWTELAAATSPTLAELLIPTNQNSNNLYAEALLKQLGRQQVNATDATEAGIAATLAILRDLGLDPAEVVMFDGSGLARKNLITPAAMVDVLQGMTRSPQAETYRNSLAIAGRSGTLRNRFRDTPVEGRLVGKSGAISRNFALAGYLDPENYSPLAFSIFLNNINERGSTARSLIDDIVLEIANLEHCH